MAKTLKEYQQELNEIDSTPWFLSKNDGMPNLLLIPFGIYVFCYYNLMKFYLRWKIERLLRP